MTSPAHALLLMQIRERGLPSAWPEFRFAPPRRWRFDICWPSRLLAVEIEGGTWTYGRHTRGKGYEEDCRKYNAAALLGYQVFRFTTAMVLDKIAIEMIEEALR